MHKFLVIFEKAENNYSAYVPDMPGCIATGDTKKEAADNIHAAIEMHIKGLKEDSLPIPESQASVQIISID